MKKLVILVFILGFVVNLKAQTNQYPPLVTFTTQEDHANMMQQLGVKAVRPGPSGNESDPNHANYDESIANPCPVLPSRISG